jgi:hypothetical protein
MNKARKKYISVQGFPESRSSVLSRTEKGHGNFFFKGHFARRIYQKGHIEKIG